jgi:Ulp1 protease family, C-terminal catalytic domain
VINYALHEICSKAKDADVDYMDPLFYSALQSQGTTLQWRVPSSRLLLVPIIHDRHWTLLVVNHYQKKFKYYDSLQYYIVENMSDFLKNVISFFKDRLPHTQSYENEVVELCNQTNTYDCGIYVMYIAKTLVEKKWININKYYPCPTTIQRYRIALHTNLSLSLAEEDAEVEQDPESDQNVMATENVEMEKNDIDIQDIEFWCTLSTKLTNFRIEAEDMYQHVDKVEDLLNDAKIKYLEFCCAQSDELDQVAQIDQVPEVAQNVELWVVEESDENPLLNENVAEDHPIHNEKILLKLHDKLTNSEKCKGGRGKKNIVLCPVVVEAGLCHITIKVHSYWKHLARVHNAELMASEILREKWLNTKRKRITFENICKRFK